MRASSKAQSLSGCLGGWIGGHHQHAQIRPALADRFKNSEAVQVRKSDVQEDQVRLTVLDRGKAVAPRGRLMGPISGALKDLGH